MLHRLATLLTLVSFGFALTIAPSAWAKPPKAPPSAASAAPKNGTSAPASDADPAPEKPEFAWQMGPLPVELGHELHLDVPDGYVFLGMPDAGKLLEKNGSFHNESVLGIVTKGQDTKGQDTKGQDGDWWAVFEYEEAGYVKDDDKIDADELIKGFREGQAEANKERTQRGFSALTIEGWSEPPRYDKGQHHLVWALTVSSPEHKSVNYNTRFLGRRGYASINLITGVDKLARYRENATTLLGVTKFKSGSRYEDFNEKTDKVAEYGLIGLILGGAGLGAAKLVKIGLLAKFGKGILALLVAGKKAVFVAFAAAAAWVKRLFGGKKKPAASE